MDLQALTDFALVATHGGFGRASRASGRSKATLSRRVSELEQGLGVRLIERGTQSLRLTDEGRALHERTHGPLSEIAEAEEAVTLGASTPRGRLRVSAPLVLAHVALGRVSARFALAYPDVQLEVVADDRLVDPVEDGFDLVIRVNPSQDDRLVGRRILDDQRWVVAPPHMVMPGPSAHLEDIPSVQAVLASRTAIDVVWQFLTCNGDKRLIKPAAALRLSSLMMIRDAVLAGAGAALLPKLLVEDDVRSGRLAQWGTDTNAPVEIWALRNSRRLVGAKVRAFLDVIEQAFPGRTFVRPL
ncbi:MAG: LysR family transcriptional regulator [Rudaea sp.]|uniref:LysR family transcriptional regulator n=1 Tax=Rudaea sp. 3F27F6 TaxID=2502208 RepID=UPI0010F7FA71|nr:LysR substrate-binding domain-containing protein [Rudaea sp. 3F27F6]MBR0346014.1 LysR family transcriptional regulator [Rudaea sp.]